MSPQRARMIDDMILAGLARGTQKIYIQAVRRLAAHYHRSPDLLSEEEVDHYPAPTLAARAGTHDRSRGCSYAR